MVRVLLFLFIFSSTIFAQRREIEQLEKSLHNVYGIKQAKIHHQLGKLYTKTNNDGWKAKKHFQKAIETFSSVKDLIEERRKEYLIECYHDFANSYRHYDLFDAMIAKGGWRETSVEPFVEKEDKKAAVAVVEIYKKILKLRSDWLVDFLAPSYYIAKILGHLEHFEESLTYYQMYEKTLQKAIAKGGNKYYVSRCKYQLAVAQFVMALNFKKLKKNAKALEKYELCIKLAQEFDAISLMGNSYSPASALHLKAKNYEKAWYNAYNALKMRKKLFKNWWPSFNTKQKINYANIYQYFPFSVILSLCEIKPNPEWNAFALELTFYRKNVISNILSREREIERLAKNPALTKLHQKWRQTIKDIVKLSYKPILKEREIKNLQSLRTQKGLLEIKISKESKKFANLVAFSPTTAREVQKQLPTDVTLLEFVTFDKNVQEKWIGVFIVKKTSIKFVTLGAYKSIEKTTRDIRQAIIGVGNNYPKLAGEKAKTFLLTQEQPLAKLTHKLYKTLWSGEVENAVKDSKLVLIAPDACLHFLPFSALSTNLQGKPLYLVEKYPLLYLSSGASLVNKYPKEGKGFYGIADPDYDYSRQKGIYTPGTSSAKGGWMRLEQGKKEVDTIQKNFKKKYQEEIVISKREKATKDDFIAQVTGKKWVHLATHGFFLDSKQNTSNPLLHSGLVLTGGNISPEQGYITAADIALLNMSGVKCAVLSCCETGLGKHLSGIGVFGFKWAFEYAGVRYLLASLWKVPDIETFKIMTYFYLRHKRTSIWKAFLQAQRKFISNERDQKSGKIHPYFWGAFHCQGSPIGEIENKKNSQTAKQKILFVKEAKIAKRKINGKKWDSGWGKTILPDVYAKVFVKQDRWVLKYTTSIIKNQLAVQWNEATSVTVKPGMWIKIKVYDKDALRDDVIGEKEFAITSKHIIKGSFSYFFGKTNTLVLNFKEKK